MGNTHKHIYEFFRYKVDMFWEVFYTREIWINIFYNMKSGIEEI
jgi:hypothetical protein